MDALAVQLEFAFHRGLIDIGGWLSGGLESFVLGHN